MTRGGLRAALGEALSAELLRLELLAARAWQTLSLLGVIGSIILSFTVSRSLGVGGAITSACFFSWFTFAASRLARGEASPLVVGGTSLVEVMGPWVFATVLVQTQGTAYALGSWVPPMIHCGMIVASTVRLRPIPPLFQGAIGAIAYLIFYFAFARQRLSPELAAFVLYRPGVQITRAITLFIVGALGALLAISLRRAIGRADSVVRQRDLFGKYRLLGSIASGGMGTVVEALYCPEGGFERRVAVKRIHPHLAEQRTFVDAFRAEAELCARLSHPNIVQVVDFGRVEDTYFLAMEFVDGLTLARFMSRAFARRVQIPIDVAAHIAKQLLAGLYYSHDIARDQDGRPLRVVHRDLCPQNVLLSKSAEVKITDFGIARALGEAASAHTGVTRGHVAYLAPEQLRGLALSPKCDLFAVGVIFWEMLASERLFARASEAATLAAVLAGRVPPVSGYRAELSADYDALFQRALAESPEDRYSTAAEMLRAIESLPGSSSDRAAESLAALVTELAQGEDTEEPSQNDVATVDVTN
jgi:serine/threonine-protein kinase